MPTRKPIQRILKFLGKLILGLLLLFFIFLLLIHTTTVQRRIANRLSSYLAATTKGKVEIDDLTFSLLGNITIKGLRVWDPDSNQVVSAGIIAVKSNIFDILTGDYLFNEIRLEELKVNLKEGKDGLNILFLLNAFAPKSGELKDTISSDITVRSKIILFHNVDFAFLSGGSGTDIHVHITELSGEHAAYTTKGNSISADKIVMNQSQLNLFMKSAQDTLTNMAAPNQPPAFDPDFGMGLGLVIKDLEINATDFSFHQDSIFDTAKFDPAHLVIHNLQTKLSDFKMNPDTLLVSLNMLNAQLPGFAIHDAGAQVDMNRHQLKLTDLHLLSGEDEVQANLTAAYDTTSVNIAIPPDIEFDATAKINPAHFAYFLTDDILNSFQSWKTTDFMLQGNYLDGTGNLKNLGLKTSNSELHVEGQMTNILDPEKIAWQDLSVHGTIGTDFKNILTRYMGELKMPSSIGLQLVSTGSPNKMFIDGKVLTEWGNADAKGNIILQGNEVGLDMKLSGQHVQLAPWIEQDWLGPIDMTAEVKGKVGTHQDLQIHGEITAVALLNQTLHKITFESNVQNERITANYTIDDQRYQLQGHTAIELVGPMIIANQLQLDSFQLGRLMDVDTSMILSGDLVSEITIYTDSMSGYLHGQHLLLKNQHSTYSLDTLTLEALLSPSASHFNFLTPNGKGNLTANFDLQQLPALVQPWLKNILYPTAKTPLALGNRELQFEFDFNDPSSLHLLGLAVDDLSAISANGKLEEANHSAHLDIHSGTFKGYGVSFDTLSADLSITGDQVEGKMNGKRLFYHAFDLGNLNFNAQTEGDTTIADLVMSYDTASYLGIGVRIFQADGGAYIYPSKLSAFNKDYQFNPSNGVFLTDSNVVVNDFVITQDSMQLSLNGNLHAFHAEFRKLDLTPFNPILSTTDKIITKGFLNGHLKFAEDQQLDIKAEIDSLILYNSFPVTVTLSAVKDHDEVPFEFLLSNADNQVAAHGKYFLNEESIDASLQMMVNNPEMFGFLYEEYLSDINGTISGNATVHGTTDQPIITGNFLFNKVNFTTADPAFAFYIKKDSILVNNNGLKLDHFTLYDQKEHPLTISGEIITSQYPAYAYDLNIHAENYDLINHPDTVQGSFKGLLTVDSEINLKGNEKDTYLNADVRVKKETKLTYVMANGEDELLNTMGVVEFVDPGQLIDTTHLATSESMYDSIMANLPDFNITSNIKIDSATTLKIITDEQSGDFFEAVGGGTLDWGTDRTGNPHISGNYTIHKGRYRLSFYDLVKKTFSIVPGSSIHWSGSPESGELDIKAVYQVATNSLGLVGHEIGENEKETYKRTLEYVVGINIKGTLEKPVISFSLDLPQEDKSSYPLLANKLDRLRLPEFQTELNKQVFGLLVLGGFMPETSVAEIDQAQVATTAIYNSVNALLATQLNRFASQYVKGVNIDVGIQSYADYSTPGGKTQTAMDFRVSKSIFNERLSFEVGGDVDLNSDQSGANTGNNYRGDVAIIYDLTGNGDKQLKLFNNESYDIIYQEIRNTGISLIFIREFNKGDLSIKKTKQKAKEENKAKEEKNKEK